MRVSIDRPSGTSIITYQGTGSLAIISCTIGAVDNVVFHCTIGYVRGILDVHVCDDDRGVLVDGRLADFNRR